MRSKSVSELRQLLNVSRQAARALLRTTLKAQRVEAGRAKQVEREKKLGSKRERRAAKAAEKERIGKVALATKYSQLKGMAIPELQDQLRAFKLKAATQIKFTVTQKGGRVGYCTQLQALLHEAHGSAANDLEGDDSGCDGDGVVRKVRKREGTGATAGNKKRKADGWCEIAGYWWQPAVETFLPERLLDKKVEIEKKGKVRRSLPLPRIAANTRPHSRLLPEPLLQLIGCNLTGSPALLQGAKRKDVEVVYYKVLWSTFPPECATWEPESSIHDDFIDEYETGMAEMEAEEDLDAEEEAEDDEEEDGDSAGVLMDTA